jgi:hypothetical protein
VWINFFGKTDGRDKMAKGLQNFFRFMKYTYQDTPDLKEKYKGLQDSLSEFRSIIKFFKWLGSFQDCSAILSQCSITSIDYVSLFANACDAGYKLGDNIEYLCTYRVLGSPSDAITYEFYSKTFQFFAYSADLVVDLFGYFKVKNAAKDDPEKQQKARLDLIASLADWLRVTPGFCAMYKVGGLQKHDGFSGMMGMIVGIVGSYKVYQKSLK